MSRVAEQAGATAATASEKAAARLSAAAAVRRPPAPATAPAAKPPTPTPTLTGAPSGEAVGVPADVADARAVTLVASDALICVRVATNELEAAEEGVSAPPDELGDGVGAPAEPVAEGEARPEALSQGVALRLAGGDAEAEALRLCRGALAVGESDATGTVEGGREARGAGVCELTREPLAEADALREGLSERSDCAGENEVHAVGEKEASGEHEGETEALPPHGEGECEAPPLGDAPPGGDLVVSGEEVVLADAGALREPLAERKGV